MSPRNPSRSHRPPPPPGDDDTKSGCDIDFAEHAVLDPELAELAPLFARAHRKDTDDTLESVAEEWRKLKEAGLAVPDADQG